MRFEWFVARRYLRSPHRPAVLRLVTLFSIVGVAAGVATLVIALAMNTGFRETLQDRLLGVTAHISLTRPGPGGIRDYEALAAKLVSDTGSSLRNARGLPNGADVVRGRSARRGDEGHRSGARAEERRGAAAYRGGRTEFFAADQDGIEALLVGKQLAEEWKLSPGDYVTLTSPQGRLTPFGMLPRSRRFRVAGVFDSGFYDYDQNWCFLTLTRRAESFRRRRPGECAGISARQS